MGALACGLDIGTTNLKVVLMDGHGTIRWARAVPTPRGRDDAGPLGDPPALLALAEDLVIAGWREAGAGVPLSAIAGAGVGEDGFLVDASARPRSACIPWFDGRAGAEAAELRASPAASPRLGLAPDPARTAAKWLWHARRGGSALPGGLWVALSDYPAIAWSGRAFMSETLAARTAAYDVFARRWDEAVLRAAGAPTLPDVLVAGAVVGTVTGERLLASGAATPRTLVVAGGHDHPVAASYVRRLQPGAVVHSMGTAELVYGERPPPAEPRFDPLVAFSVPVDGGAGLACLGVQELAAGIMPYRRSAHGDLVAALLSHASLPGAPAGAATLARARAQGPSSLSALPPGEALGLCRAMIEELGFVALDMQAAIGGDGALFATGGWSRSDALMELRASLFGRTIARMAEDELTGAGAALIALSATRDFDPARLRSPPVARFEPRADWAAAYRRVGLARGS